MSPASLPDQFEDAFKMVTACIERGQLSKDEIDHLVADTVDWEKKRSTLAPPVRVKSLQFSFRGESLEISMDWSSFHGLVEQETRWKTGGPQTKKLMATFRSPMDREGLLTRSHNHVRYLLEQLNLTQDEIVQFEHGTPRRYSPELQRAQMVRALALRIGSRYMEPDASARNPDDVAYQWYKLGYWNAKLENQTVPGAGDGNTLEQNAQGFQKERVPRWRTGKQAGRQKQEDAKLLRDRVRPIAVELRRSRPLLTDEELAEAVHKNLRRKIAVSTVRTCIRELIADKNNPLPRRTKPPAKKRR